MSSILLLFLTRRGSLHALEQTRNQRFWSRWLGRPIPSADTLGRVSAQIELESLRSVLYQLYHRFRRNKVFSRKDHRWAVLILDGHESSCSYRRSCPGCLRRRIHMGTAEVIQYYHRNVTAQLRLGSVSFLLDAEPQRPGESEVGAALRLFRRVVRRIPRAFELVVADGLYAQTDFFRAVQSAGKDLIVVLKENRPDLLHDARDLFAKLEPRDGTRGRSEHRCWDDTGFTTWPDLAEHVRVVRSLETTRRRRQLDRTIEVRRSDWFWVTTLSPERASTEDIIELGHGRWTIENQGFQELARHWHADHVFRHEPNAIQVFWLLALMACNLFQVFVDRQIHPPRRSVHTRLYWAELMAAELYQDVAVESWIPPP